MVLCCQKFQEALNNRKIISSNDRYYFCEHNVADDGDGYIDEWEEEDENFEIMCCPFCGKLLAG